MIFVYIAVILVIVTCTFTEYRTYKTKVDSYRPSSRTCSFHDLAENLDKAKSCRDFTMEILDLIDRIMLASRR